MSTPSLPADPYDAIKTATRDAAEQARNCVDEAIEAADAVRATQSGDAFDLFEKRAAFALTACDGWRDWFEILCSQIEKGRHG